MNQPFVSPRNAMKWAICIVCLLCVTACTPDADTPIERNSTPATAITSNLSNQKVKVITEDAQGHIWMGTFRGLNKFNAHEYHQYFCNDNDSTSLPDNQIQDLLRDSRGQLWVATVNGVCRYTDRDCFEKVPIPGPNQNAVQLLELRNGRILLNMGVHLYAYDTEQDAFTCIHNVFDPNKALNGRCHIDLEGSLWDVKPYALRRYDPNTLQLCDSIPTHQWFTTSYMDNNGLIWLGGDRQLACFDTKTRQMLPTPSCLSQHPLLTQSNVTLFHQYGSQGILINTDEYGLFYYNRQQGSVVQAQENGFPFEAPDFRINSFYTDSHQNLWIGSLDQGYTVRYHYKERFNHDNYLRTYFAEKSVVSMVCDRRGLLWISTLMDGLYVYCPQNHVIKPIENFPRNKKSMTWLFTDREDKLWIATANNKIYCCRYEEHRLVKEQEYTCLMPISFAQSDDGTLYVGTATHYIGVLRPGEAEFKPLQVLQEGYTFIPAMEPTTDGKLLVAGFGHEMRLVDNTTLQVSKLPVAEGDYAQCIRRSKFIPTCILTDTRGELWIGTVANGLLHYHPETHRLTSVPGAPCTDIGSIEEDRMGNLWVSTMYGLGKYDRTVNRFTNYFAADGLGGNQFYDRSSCRLPDGTLVFGGTHGLTFFNPIDPPVNRHVSILFQDLKVHNRLIHPAPQGSPIARHLSYCPHVRLSYDQSSFSLSFAALDYNEHQRVRYAYRMEGFDRYWVESGNLREATYANLPAGHYTFRVRAYSSDLDTHEAESAIEITVGTAPWLTWWAWCLYLLISAGLIALFVRNVRRIRKEKQLVRKAREEKEQEQRVNRMNMSFFANVSHEFRTPLTMISGPVAQLCQSERIPEGDRRLLLIVQRSVARMLRLVNQMMDFNKLENDTLRLQVSRTDIIGELQRYLDIFRVNAAEKGITLVTHGLEEQFTLWLDADKLDKIVGNLMSNALKFTPTGGEIALNFDVISREAARTLHPLSSHDTSTRYVKIEVADTGQGIPQDQLEKVFERYYQVEKPKGGTNYNWGTGIGLYYARALAVMHHGTLWASHRTEGPGTLFTLLIPADEAAYSPEERTPEETKQSQLFPLPTTPTASTSAETASTVESSARTGFSAGTALGPDADASSHASAEREKKDERQTLLVVDDDAEVTYYLDALLGAHYRIVCRFTADSAFRAMQEEAPDLVLSDVVMPGKSGYDLCREIKNDPQLCHIPVILVTAKATVENQVEGLEHGADAYVTKPFDPTYLLALIQSQLKNREKVRALLSSLTRTDKMAEDTLTPQDNAFMTDLYRLMESELSNPELDVARMTELMHTSRTKFYYKVKGLTGQNPGTFFKTYKLNRAAQLLAEGKYTVSEVADMTGFSTASHFSTSFKKQFGTAPSDYPGS